MNPIGHRVDNSKDKRVTGLSKSARSGRSLRTMVSHQTSEVRERWEKLNGSDSHIVQVCPDLIHWEIE